MSAPESGLPNGALDRSPRSLFYTIKEASELVNVSSWVMWNWIKNRKKNAPPWRRFGPKLYRIPKDEFHKWMRGK